MEESRELQTTNESYIIHKSLVPLVIKLIVMTLILIAVLVLLAVLIALLQKIAPFKINWFYVMPLVVLFVLFYGGYTIILILNWVDDIYIISPNSIVIRQGLFWTKEENYSVRVIKNMQIFQGIIGKTFNFGDIEINFLGGKAYLESLPKPHYYEQILRRFHPQMGESTEDIKELQEEDEASE